MGSGRMGEGDGISWGGTLREMAWGGMGRLWGDGIAS